MPIDVMMGGKMVEGTSTDSFQMFTGRKSSQTSLINNWSFVFIIMSELGLGEEVKAWFLCCLVCLELEDKPRLPFVSYVAEKGNITKEEAAPQEDACCCSFKASADFKSIL